MPFNILLFVTRKPGITPAQFEEHYEKHHVQMIMEMAGDTVFKYHKRQYTTLNEKESPLVLFGDKSVLNYDCIADLEFESEAAFQKFYDVMNTKENTTKRNEDEDGFIDRSQLKYLVVSKTEITYS
ncbi:MAG: hypothetical protein M1821_000517 [Bathelium mastoideum]|nr:MAG: hypothetical protein M1821_000517 [Bathelium mastoideum]